MAKTCGGFMFGSTPIFGVVVESQSAETGPQYAAQAKDEDGVTVAVQLGKQTGTASISGYKNTGAALPDMDTAFDLDGRKFFPDKVSVQKSSTEFQKVDISAKFWEGVETTCP
jgi:hypothetical protein